VSKRTNKKEVMFIKNLLLLIKVILMVILKPSPRRFEHRPG